MSQNEEVDIFKVLSWSFTALNICGFKFLARSPGVTRKQKIIYYGKLCYFGFFCLNFALGQVGVLIYLCTTYEHLSITLHEIGLVAHMLVILLKLVAIYRHRIWIRKALKKWGCKNNADLSREVIKKNEKVMKILHKFKIIRVTIIIGITLYMCFWPVMNLYLNGIWYRDFSWKFWLPFDQYSEKYYNFAFWWVNWIIVNISLVFFATDMLIYGLASMVIIQMNILSHDMREAMNWNGNLSPLICRHYELIKLAKRINEIFSGAFLVMLIGTSVKICFTTFLITNSRDWNETIKFTSILFSLLSQIIALCGFGQLLENSSQNVFNAVRSSRWHEDNKKVKFGVLMISMAASKSCKLSAWKFSPLNLASLMIVLHNAYSYYAVLKSLQKTRFV